MIKTHLEATRELRDELYASIGRVEPDVVAHWFNSAFLGAAAWPAQRQSFSVIRRDNSNLLITDGLSDPFANVGTKNSGFALELYAESKQRLQGPLADSVLFKLVCATAQQVAHSGQIAALLRRHGVLTMELYAEDCGLSEFQNKNGMVGVIIGVESPDIQKSCEFPGGEVILASVQMLTADELAYVVNAGTVGRQQLCRALQNTGLHHYLSPRRASVLTPEYKPAPVRSPAEKSAGRAGSSRKARWKFW